VNPAPRNTHVDLVNAVTHGRDTHWLTRRALAEAGPEGSRAMQTLDKYGTKVKYTQGGGSFYDHATNTVTIDLNNGNPAVGLVHEATHVQWGHQGHSANIATMGRNDYVNRMLSEEADGTVRQVYANIHLQNTQPHLNLPNTSLQHEFTQGYNSAAHQAEMAAQAQGRTLTANERALAGDAGGRQAVYNAFQGGGVTTSNTGTPYPQYYGQAWDSYQNYMKQSGQIP
jgi:hypothetical protein